jgi:GT2 family glycosyltransferase
VSSLPDVTVVVIAWNVRDELSACFQSLRDHAGSLSLEPIYVDNGSTDGSAELVAERFSEVRIVRRPTNEGVPARNHGLRLARGRHRMLLDSDARLTAGALPTAVDVLESNPRIGLVGPRLIYPDGRLQLSCRRYPPLALPVLRRPPLDRFFEDGRTVRHHLMADAAHDRQRRVEYVLGACQVFRAEVQEAAGEFDPAIWYGHDDAHWCFAIRMAGYDIAYVPEAEVVHDYRRSSAAKPFSMMSLRMLKAHVHFQRTWWPHRTQLIQEGRAMDVEAAAEVDAGC